MNILMKLGVTGVLLFAVFTVNAEPERDRKKSGTWVAIVPPAIESAIGPLAEHRKAQGWDVQIKKRDELGADQGLELKIRGFLQDIVEDEAVAKPVVAVLAGIPMAPKDSEEDAVIPAIKGNYRRMIDVAADSLYSLKNDKPLDGLAVGRLPARNAGEMEAMIAKILKFESEPGAERWKTKLSVVAASTGGGPIADAFIGQQLNNRLKKLPSRWTMEQVADLNGSWFTVPKNELKEKTKSLLERGQLFSCYIGHAAPGAVSSDWVEFFNREDFSSLVVDAGGGVFLTCGCESLAVDVPGKDGHGFAAMRSLKGPAAFIGAEHCSYAAMGLLAIDGLVKVINDKDRNELTLADCWRSIFAGIDSGEIHPTVFMLMDRGDGTGGAVPLVDQRKEHLQMWMMLGDPAMKIPLIPGGIELQCDKNEVVDETSLKVSGKLPAEWQTGIVQLSAERSLGSKPIGGENAPEKSKHALANEFVLSEKTVNAENGSFEATLSLPKALPEEKIVIRALVGDGERAAQGTIEIPVIVPEENEEPKAEL